MLMSKVANGATASKLAGASSGPGLRSSDRSKYSDCAQSISGSNSGSSAGTIGFGRDALVRLRQKALRAGVWFKALSRIDRVLVDLTIKVADTIRSPHLVQSLSSIAEKISRFVESKFSRAIREVGLIFASKVSQIAQSWGYRAAAAWANDAGFARFWAAMKLNGHPCSCP